MRRVTLTAAVMALTLMAAGCQGSDRAGGNAAEDVVVLTLVQAIDEPPEQLVAFADRVEERSGGTLTIEFRSGWRTGEPEVERGIVQDVKDGDVAMGWVGARVFDRFGTAAFQPLLAPLLVDSHDLQREVFETSIPDQMLASLDTVGLVGVGVLPGPLRKLLSKGDPLTVPSALTGLSIGIQDSGVAEQTFAALGATAVNMPSGAKIADVDGYEQQLSSIWGNHYEEQGAKSVVGNLNLWPRPLVIVAGQQQWDALSADQQETLRGAAKDAVGPALDASRDEDARSVEDICAAGITMPQATAAHIAGFERKLSSVNDAISKADPRNKEWLDQIRQLKDRLGAGADTSRCDSEAPAQGADGPLPEGAYEMTLTPDDIRSGCPAGQPGSENMAPLLNHPQTLFQTVVKGDSLRQYFRLGGPSEPRELGFFGTYRMFRDKFEIREDGAPDPLVFDYTFDGKTLTLSDLNGQSCDHVVSWTSHPWVRAGN